MERITRVPISFAVSTTDASVVGETAQISRASRPSASMALHWLIWVVLSLSAETTWNSAMVPSAL